MSSLLIAAAFAFGLLMGPPRPAVGQDAAAVNRAIERGIELLAGQQGADNRLGAEALVGLTLLKFGSNPDHPRIQAAVEAVRADLPADDAPDGTFSEVYSPALATIFLIELDPVRHREAIDPLWRYLLRVQKPHGAWGYPDRKTGDTSMTQYGVLAMWEAWRAGLDVPPDRVNAVLGWLLKTQDPSGGFGYQGRPSPAWQPIQQSEVRHSLTAAALGSIYMCADMLGVDPQADNAAGEGLPGVVRRVEQEKPPGQPAAPGAPKPLKIAVPTSVLRTVQQRGNAWMKENWSANPDQWTFYYLYALERYMTFRERAEGENHGLNWYPEGAENLLRKQEGDGGWRGQAGTTADTAFALLFLMRAMKDTVEEAAGLGEGLMVGGRGLPKATDAVEVRRGQVVARSLDAPAEQLLAILDDPDDPRYDQALRQLREMPSETARRLFQDKEEAIRRRLAEANPERRLAAVAALSARENLDAAPWLIAALTDEDRRVSLAARDGLRRLARRPEGFGLNADATAAEKILAADRWKKWYRAIRPGAAFLDR